MGGMRRWLLLFAAVFASLFVIQFAAPEAKAVSYSDYTYTLISRTSETIAPGVTHETVYLRMDRDQQQMVIHGLIVETSNPEYKLEVKTNYMDNQYEKFGLQKLTEQLAAAQKNHAGETDYNIIGGVNGDYYEMSNGAPMNTFVMDGTIINDVYHRKGPDYDKEDGYAKYYPYFAFTDYDGSDNFNYPYYTYPLWKWQQWEKDKDHIIDAIGGDPILVVNDTGGDGGRWVEAIDVGYDNQNDLNARTAVGVTAKNDVVLVVVDGKQLPYSRGASMGDLGIVMRDVFGCIQALNLDGGGSSTMVAKPEGENDLKILNKPCDGFERKTSTSLMIVSHYVDPNGFDHVALSTENIYVSPGSTVDISAKGVTPGGNAADIPDDAAWSLSSSSTAKGTVTNGKFVSDGTTGDAIIEVNQGGKLRGSITIHVVQPSTFAFSTPTFAVPYGESIELTLKAADSEGHLIAINPDAINIVLDNNALGTITGMTLKACDKTTDDNSLEGNVTVTYTYGTVSMTDSAKLTVGKGSEVIITFEEENAPSLFFTGSDYGEEANEKISIEVVDSTTGKVHDGTHALKVTLDRKNLADLYSGSGFFQPYLKLTPKYDITGAIGLGAWVWVPDEDVQSQLRLWAVSDGKYVSTYPYVSQQSLEYDDGHWFYLYLPLENYTANTSYIGNKNYFLHFYFIQYGGATDVSDEIKSINNELTFYLDSITVDYSAVVPDREFPVIGDVSLNGTTVMKRGEITASASGTISITAPVSDNVGVTDVQVLVDGVAVDATNETGTLTASGVKLAAGVHTIKLVVTDAAGNAATVIRQVKITENADVATVKLVPSAKNDPLKTENGNLFIGSVYYLDVVATDVTAIDGIDMDLDLVNNATWELDAAEVDPNFTLTYSVDEADNIAHIHIERSEIPCAVEAGQVIATLPLRTWVSTVPFQYGTGNSLTLTAELAWEKGYFAPVDIRVDVDKGAITYAEGKAPETLAAFGSARIQKDTELYANHTVVKAANTSKTHWHLHDTELTSVDIDATCLTPGWTDRKICETCGSPVEWGTKVDPLGHDYQIDEESELLKCTRCGVLYNGSFEYETGVTGQFVNGVLQQGWLNDHYYLEGQKVDGFQFIGGKLYKFEDHTCAGKTPYTGEYTDQSASKTFYYEAGVKKSGWVEDKYYYGETDGKYIGHHEIEGKLYYFDETGLCTARNGFTGTYNDLYYVDGAIYSGWTADGRYYIEGKGVDGLQKIEETYYMFIDGVCEGQKPFTGENSGLYYLNGKLRTGWDEENHYYKAGVMQTGYVSIPDDNGQDKLYFFDDEGVCEGKTPFTGTYQDVYYENGTPGNGWAGESYYQDGARLKGFHQLDDGKLYFFDEEGVCAGKTPYTGDYNDEGYIDGVKTYGWVLESYYDEDTGKYYGVKEVDGLLYDFGDQGVCPGKTPFTGEHEGKGYIDGEQTFGWVGDKYFDETDGKLEGFQQLPDGFWYLFGEDGVCANRLPYTGVQDGKQYFAGVIAEGWEEDEQRFYVEGVYITGLNKLPDGLYYLFDEEGVCDGMTPYTGDHDGITYVQGVIAQGWGEDNRYYVDGVYYTGYQTIDDLWYRFGETGVCDGRSPYTGFFEVESTRHYALAGVLQTGWFQVAEDRYHADEDGVVHSHVTTDDPRVKCTDDYRLKYICDECGEISESQTLWGGQHSWDSDHVCTVCQTVGMDIGEATLEIAGKYFVYTDDPGGVRAAHTVTYNGKSLNIRSDRMGLDGFAEYYNNTDIGVATLHIEGRGDYYGELVGTFTIVPANVTTVSSTQVDHSTLTITWEPALGADYYELYRQNTDSVWTMVGSTEGTSYTVTGLELGASYNFRLAGVADRDGESYYSTKWSNEVTGTVDHAWVSTITPATCTENGFNTRVCSDCGETTEVVIPATGHNVTEWEITAEATKTSPGSRHGICANCGEDVTEIIPKLPSPTPGGGSTGGGFTGGGNGSSSKPETVTNPDGSKTTTTNNADGSKTETTQQTDGTVTEKVTQPDGSSTQRTTTPEGVIGKVDTDAQGKVTAAEVVIPKETAEQDVVTAPVEVPAVKNAADAPEIRVKAGSDTVTKVEIPVTEYGPGTVAVVVNPDGTETVVRDCVIGKNGVVLNVEGDVTLKIVDNTETFVDVEPVNHWATDAVEFVAARELFNGTGNHMFTPNGNMTRGMMVTVLYRLAYEPETVAEHFTDLAPNAYYVSAVSWAENAGIVTGYSNDVFGPDDNITREQLVTILYRYAAQNGYHTGTQGSLDRYADAEAVSGYAAEAMGWAVELGLIQGVDATHLAPKSNATRAQVATILMRFCEMTTK